MNTIMARIGLVLAGAFLGGFTVSFIAANSIYDYEDTGKPGLLVPVDAVVVLAGGRGRLPVAAQIWHQYYLRAKKAKKRDQKLEIPDLYISGSGPKSNWEVLSKFVPEEIQPILTEKYVVIDNKSISTRENAIFLKRYAKKSHWKSFHLVTSGYHMRRARYIFEEVIGKNQIFETTSVSLDPYRAKRWRSSFSGIQVTISEFYKLVLYRSIEKGFW